MSQLKFTKEYEFRASPKMLYPFVSTAQGLSEWLLTEVSLDSNKNFVFKWQGDEMTGKLSAHKVNHFVKFEFLQGEGALLPHPNYLEFKFNFDELTLLTYMKVIDFSENDDLAGMEELWDQFMSNLRLLVGG